MDNNTEKTQDSFVPATIENENNEALSVIPESAPMFAAADEALAERQASPEPTQRVHVYDNVDTEDRLSGDGYAYVKGKKVFSAENKLIFIVIAIMSALCIIVSVCTALITAHFMRTGQTPPVIGTGDIQQNIAAVVASRKSCITEVSCGGLRGSGIVTKREGENVYIITNTHVIQKYVEDNARSVSVRFYGEDGFYTAKVIGYEPTYDVAVLSVAHQTVFTVYNLDGDDEVFSPSTEYAEGDYVVSIGNAMAMGVASYDGIISRKSEFLECNEIFKDGKKVVPVVRTTAVINAGMSGGGLFDMKGRLIGLGTYRMSNSVGIDQDGGADTDVENTGFVVPVSVVYSVYKRILNGANGGAASVMPITLLKNTPVDYGRYDALKQYENIRFNWIKLPFGFDCAYIGGKLTVVALDIASPSDKVNIGDVITAIGGVEINDNVGVAVGALLGYNRGGVGAKLKITAQRGNGTFTFEVSEYAYAI